MPTVRASLGRSVCVWALTTPDGMRLEDRSCLIRKGLILTGGDLHPATLTFAGHDPIAATRRGSTEGRIARAGGLTASVATTFLIDKVRLPGGLELIPQTTRFHDGGTALLLLTLDNDPSEPHVRITADLADR